MGWNIDLFNEYLSATDTLVKVRLSDYSFDGAPAELWISGTGFTYDSSGMISGGIIGSMALVNATGPSPVTVQSIEMTGGLNASGIVQLLVSARAIASQIAAWNVEIADSGETLTADGLSLPCADGSRIVLVIDGWVPDADIGTVTSIRHFSASGAVLHEVTGLPQPVSIIAMAFGKSDALYNVLVSGANTIRSSGPYDFPLDGGAGNDTIIHEPGDSGRGGHVDYYFASAAVTVDLDDGTGNERGLASGGAGSDTLYGISAITGSSFADKLTGSAAANNILGEGGADTVQGEAGSDFLAGDEGNDSLDGGADNDMLAGGRGNDTIVGGAGQDTADYGEWWTSTDWETPAPVGVTVSLAATGLQAVGANHGSDLLIGIENVSGTSYADVLRGNAQANQLEGRGGGDSLDGGAGADTLVGGAGDDTYIVSDNGDQVWENALGGRDIVRTTQASYTLGTYVENLTYTGTAAFMGAGNASANVIRGNTKADRIEGLAGNDSLYGGDGNDTLYGNAISNNNLPAGTSGIALGSGSIVKTVASGNGTLSKAIDVSRAFSLAADPEIAEATIVPHVSIRATGGGTVDYYAVKLTRPGATIAADIDHGFGSEDDGEVHVRVDILDKNGNQVSWWNSSNTSDGAGGSTSHTDGFTSYTASEAGTYYIAVSKSSMGSREPVPSGASYELQISVDGEFMTDNDQLSGEGGDDRLIGASGNDTLYGGIGADTLEGGSGNDSMEGGAGNDLYRVDSTGDKVKEVTAAGTDTIETGLSYTLGANVENLKLTGTANVNGTGNMLANEITGNAGKNTINGGLGADIIRLGAGKDTVVFSTALGNGNVDRVLDFSVADDTVLLSKSIFTALGPAGNYLSADAFYKGSAANDASDRIIYDSKTGALYYDPDGTGAAAQIQFATLSAGLAGLTRMDFWIG